LGKADADVVIATLCFGISYEAQGRSHDPGNGKIFLMSSAGPLRLP
jgi:hypothetical protein